MTTRTGVRRGWWGTRAEWGLLAALVMAVAARGALIPCPECKAQVSSEAPVCPRCGYPLRTSATNAPARTLPRSLADHMAHAEARRPEPPAASPVDAAAMREIQGALAIIETDQGSGSGFLVDMGGRRYLLTNQHVLMGARKLTLKRLDGREIKPVSLDLARQVDLARVGIGTNDTGGVLTVSTAPPIGTTVRVMGNSQGAGAVTEIPGRVLGVGPNVVEVDAAFVAGNSGSPILDPQHRVVGVATFIQQLATSWDARGTRFTAPRRFGVTVPGPDGWQSIVPGEFFRQSGALMDLETYFVDILDAVDSLALYARNRGTRNVGVSRLFLNGKYDAGEHGAQYHDQAWPRQIAALYQRYGERDTGARRVASQADLQRHNRGLAMALIAMLDRARQAAKAEKWSSAFLSERAAQLDKACEALSASLNKATAP